MPPLALIGHLTAGRAQMPAADTLCGIALVAASALAVHADGVALQ
jgi:hypothetical protein